MASRPVLLVPTLSVILACSTTFQGSGASSSITHSSAIEWPDLTTVINNADAATYLELLRPVLDATRLSYTATYGSYRKDADVNASLQGGWERIPALERDPPGGGFHGLVFHHKQSRRTLLAFRGTDLGSKDASGLADSCADKLLWHGTEWDYLPLVCRSFSPLVLDYLTAAQRFTDLAMHALQSSPSQTLLTGHSLGAGLAILVAAGRSAQQLQHKVVAFSSPPFALPLRKRVGREPSELKASDFAIVYNEFDPLFAQTKAFGGMTGITPCGYKPVSEPRSCQQCDPVKDWNLRSTDCVECFIKTHVLQSYLVHLNGTVDKRPRYRPTCTPALSEYHSEDSQESSLSEDSWVLV